MFCYLSKWVKGVGRREGGGGEGDNLYRSVCSAATMKRRRMHWLCSTVKCTVIKCTSRAARALQNSFHPEPKHWKDFFVASRPTKNRTLKSTLYDFVLSTLYFDLIFMNKNCSDKQQKYTKDLMSILWYLHKKRDLNRRSNINISHIFVFTNNTNQNGPHAPLSSFYRELLLFLGVLIVLLFRTFFLLNFF